MDAKFIVQIIIAIIAVIIVTYGLLHEDKFIAFEDKVILKAKKFFAKK